MPGTNKVWLVGGVVRVGIGRGQLSYKVGGVVGDNRCTCYIRTWKLYVCPTIIAVIPPWNRRKRD